MNIPGNKFKINWKTVNEVLECANSWDPEAMLIGNVRAGDIAAMCHEIINAGTWECQTCGFKNEISGTIQCFRCGSLRDGEDIKSCPPNQKFSPGKKCYKINCPAMWYDQCTSSKWEDCATRKEE